MLPETMATSTPVEVDFEVAGGKEAGNRREQQAAHQVGGVRLHRIRTPAGKQGEASPRKAGEAHQHGAERIGGAGAGQDETDEAQQRHRQPEPLRSQELFPFPERDAEHGELHGANQDEGARAGVQAQVGE